MSTFFISALGFFCQIQFNVEARFVHKQNKRTQRRLCYKTRRLTPALYPLLLYITQMNSFPSPLYFSAAQQNLSAVGVYEYQREGVNVYASLCLSTSLRIHTELCCWIYTIGLITLRRKNSHTEKEPATRKEGYTNISREQITSFTQSTFSVRLKHTDIIQPLIHYSHRREREVEIKNQNIRTFYSVLFVSRWNSRER